MFYGPVLVHVYMMPLFYRHALKAPSIHPMHWQHNFPRFFKDFTGERMKLDAESAKLLLDRCVKEFCEKLYGV